MKAFYKSSVILLIFLVFIILTTGSAAAFYSTVDPLIEIDLSGLLNFLGETICL